MPLNCASTSRVPNGGIRGQLSSGDSLDRVVESVDREAARSKSLPSSTFNYPYISWFLVFNPLPIHYLRA